MGADNSAPAWARRSTTEASRKSAAIQWSFAGCVQPLAVNMLFFHSCMAGWSSSYTCTAGSVCVARKAHVSRPAPAIAYCRHPAATAWSTRSSANRERATMPARSEQADTSLCASGSSMSAAAASGPRQASANGSSSTRCGSSS